VSAPWWRRWWKRLGRASEPPRPNAASASDEGRFDAPSTPRASDDAGPGDPDGPEAALTERLRRVGEAGGADVGEALAALANAGSSTLAGRLAAVLAGLQSGREHAPLRVACARLLVERGERERARGLLAPVRAPEGMMLAAELWAAEGDLGRAVSLVERVLARDVDAPGARERHERWCAQLGRTRIPPPDHTATVIGQVRAPGALRLLREAARGGTGVVYEAEDAWLGRRVAFKRYHGGARDRALVEREARIAVALAGPGVLRVLDAHPSEGWLATEWIDHGSMRELFAAGRAVELMPVARWLGKLVRALARVHGRGWVHGDVKPGNVLFRALDDPVLGDFGSGRRVGEAAPSGGTPGYLGPERLAGAPAAPGDDVYALGRILEELLFACEAAGSAPGAELAALEGLARACLAAAPERPADAAAVLSLLDGA
jgi:serine/threonine-protein kinase